MLVSILVAINQLFNHFKDITDMYDSLYRNLRLWTVRSNESSFGKIGQVEARSKQDFIKFYKVLATVKKIAFYFLVWWHFLTMIMMIMLISGTVSFLFPRFPSSIILIASGLIGFVYSLFIDGEALMFSIVVINIVGSLIPVLMFKYLFYLQRKAEKMQKLDC